MSFGIILGTSSVVIKNLNNSTNVFIFCAFRQLYILIIKYI